MHCAHCGVELMESAQKCPLCQTSVYDAPALTNVAFTTSRKRLGRRERLNLLLSTLSLHVIAVTLATDLAINHGLTWSPYAMNAVALVYLWMFFPLCFSKVHEGFVITFQYGVLTLYLWQMERAVGGRWFFTFALPVAMMLLLLSLSLTTLLKRYPRHALIIVGGSWIIIGGMLMLVETLLNLTFGGSSLLWSPYVMINFFAIGALVLILAFSPALRDKFEKRLFI